MEWWMFYPRIHGFFPTNTILEIALGFGSEMGFRSATSYFDFDGEWMKRIAEEAGFAPTGRSIGAQREYSVNLNKCQIE